MLPSVRVKPGEPSDVPLKYAPVMPLPLPSVPPVETVLVGGRGDRRYRPRDYRACRRLQVCTDCPNRQGAGCYRHRRKSLLGSGVLDCAKSGNRNTDPVCRCGHHKAVGDRCRRVPVSITGILAYPHYDGARGPVQCDYAAGCMHTGRAGNYGIRQRQARIHGGACCKRRIGDRVAGNGGGRDDLCPLRDREGTADRGRGIVVCITRLGSGEGYGTGCTGDGEGGAGDRCWARCDGYDRGGAHSRSSLFPEQKAVGYRNREMSLSER
jgi:hypothetical protein